jgi:hypothetical protein
MGVWISIGSEYGPSYAPLYARMCALFNSPGVKMSTVAEFAFAGTITSLSFSSSLVHAWILYPEVLGN